MADRSSAEIFGDVFHYLSKQSNEPATKKFAKFMWERKDHYDFSTYQMECDNALVKLGLAKRGQDADGYETVLYKGEDY